MTTKLGEEMGLCSICSYRLEERFPVLLQPVLQMSKEIPQEGPVCPVCLGIFRYGFLVDLSEKVHKLITDKEYDSESFALAVGLPSSVGFREKVALKRFGRSAADLDAKVTVKHAISVILTNMSDLKYDAKSDLQVTVAITNEPLLALDLAVIETADKSGKNAGRNKRSKFAAAKFSKKADLGNFEDAAASVESLASLASASTPCTFEVVGLRAPIFFGARYNKYSRSLNQTAWSIDGRVISSGSVDEIISGPLTEATHDRSNQTGWQPCMAHPGNLLVRLRRILRSVIL